MIIRWWWWWCTFLLLSVVVPLYPTFRLRSGTEVVYRLYTCRTAGWWWMLSSRWDLKRPRTEKLRVDKEYTFHSSIHLSSSHTFKYCTLCVLTEFNKIHDDDDTFESTASNVLMRDRFFPVQFLRSVCTLYTERRCAVIRATGPTGKQTFVATRFRVVVRVRLGVSVRLKLSAQLT